ncbi:MAG: hypothetical protein FK732_02690 [Asgard group archaeon]|nr:hypothetical protein [Asgard group archaeon]
MFGDFIVFLQELKQAETTQDANLLIKSVSNIDNLLVSLNDKDEFIEFLEKKEKHDSKKSKHESKEWGDVQTPKNLVEKIYEILADSNFDPSIIIEPTSGTGGFILSAPKFFYNLKLIYGVEIQKQYIWLSARKLILEGLKQEKQKFTHSIQLIHDDIFSHKFDSDITNSDESILIVGNPPWITISELSFMNSNNMPRKSNIKKLKGIDALTGKSNFDITESIITKLINLFSKNKGKIAILCKNSVVRNILKESKNKQFNLSNIQALSFNAKEYFGKVCNASLFIADFTPSKSETFCSIANLDTPNTVIAKMGWYKDYFVSNIAKYQHQSQLEGQFPYNWRQGIKHDCASVLELQRSKEGELINKKNDLVEIEEDLIYPLLKGSSLRVFSPQDFTKKLILTQTKLSEDTRKIKEKYPRTWQYLMKNKKSFMKRKSRVYQKKPQFAIFGVGEYVLSPYKVAIAGFYKKPLFALITPQGGKPVLFDDTCYYLSFQKYKDALFTCSVLNCNELIDFLESIVFVDSKRPFTKEILMRVNLVRLVKNSEFSSLNEIWKRNDFTPKIKTTISDYKDYQKKIIKFSN